MTVLAAAAHPAVRSNLDGWVVLVALIALAVFWIARKVRS